MKKNVLFIINPKAGKGKHKCKINQVIDNFKKIKYEVDIAYTKPQYLPFHILRDYKKEIDILVCCGGDGTLNETINAIVDLNLQIDLTFLPAGTMNDFEKSINLSKRKLLKINSIDDFNNVYSDIGMFNKRCFNYVAAFGAFTEVSYSTPQKLKNVFGKLAYFIIAAKHLFKIKSYNIKVKYDEIEIEDKFIYGAISNSKSVAGLKWFDKETVKLDDGYFEILLIKRPRNLVHLIKIFYCFFRKKYNSTCFLQTKIRNVEIESKDKIQWTLDGEDGGKAKKVIIENITKRIKYVIPK